MDKQTKIKRAMDAKIHEQDARIEDLESKLTKQIGYKEDYKAAFMSTHGQIEALERQVKAADAFLEIFRAWRHSDSTSERVRLMGRMIAASSAYTAAKEGGV